MLIETKQKPISGGGTATWVNSDYKVSFTATQEATWQPTNAPTNQTSFVLMPRIANLHAGAAWMRDDFDLPLPEDFLIRDE